MKIHYISFTAKEKAELLEKEIPSEPKGSEVLVKNHFDLISALKIFAAIIGCVACTCCKHRYEHNENESK